MKNGKQPFVIAIAGISGGGKTTIATQLMEPLKEYKSSRAVLIP
ncbi:adenylyl-sulfate kinase [Paenibacillus wynnii]|nr:adenylyl-sulfate kinase [Paenibacillus wynnii]MDQ0195841.1 uridine kinase [Paenibacillus wynnii]